MIDTLTSFKCKDKKNYQFWPLLSEIISIMGINIQIKVLNLAPIKFIAELKLYKI